MTIKQNKAVVTRFNKEVIEGKNENLFDELFDPGFINRTVRPGFPPGPEGMLMVLQNVFWKAFTDIRVEIHEQIGEGDLVTTRKTIHGLHTGEFMGMAASDKKIQFNIIDIVRVRNGKYFEHWGVFDLNNVMMQIAG